MRIKVFYNTPGNKLAPSKPMPRREALIVRVISPERIYITYIPGSTYDRAIAVSFRRISEILVEDIDESIRTTPNDAALNIIRQLKNQLNKENNNS